MRYQWMHNWLAELAEVRAAERRTKRRLKSGHTVRKGRRKGSAAVNILRLVQQLREEDMSVQRIMADYDVTRRTVYNWIDTIEKAEVCLTRTTTDEGIQLRVASKCNHIGCADIEDCDMGQRIDHLKEDIEDWLVEADVNPRWTRTEVAELVAKKLHAEGWMA